MRIEADQGYDSSAYDRGNRGSTKKAGGTSRAGEAASYSRYAQAGRSTGRADAYRGSTRGQNDASPYNDRNRYAGKKRRRSKKPLAFACVLVVLLLCGGGLWLYFDNKPIKVTVNNTAHEVSSKATLSTLTDAKYVKVDPGDFVAVDGSVLEKGKGKAFTATIDGSSVDDPGTRLHDGAQVTIGKGGNIVEPADETKTVTPFKVVEKGVGPLHVYLGDGTDGVVTTKTGKISKKTVQENTTALQNETYLRYRANVGNDKVIALTFDDGPWPTYTDQILSILQENDVKATFFTVGENIDNNRASLVKKADAAGHQICTHTWDHARGKGKSLNIGLMPAEDQIAEIKKGYDAIAAVTGKPASKVIRAPGGNFDNATQNILAPYVSAEIGWTIDTRDWKQPGVAAIVAQIQSAKPGDVILLHDGGGERAQTVEAVKQAIPYLKSQGFKFITIDEMLAYPRPS